MKTWHWLALGGLAVAAFVFLRPTGAPQRMPAVGVTSGLGGGMFDVPAEDPSKLPVGTRRGMFVVRLGSRQAGSEYWAFETGGVTG